LEELPEDGTILPQYVGVIKNYTTAYMLYMHFVGVVKENML